MKNLVENLKQKINNRTPLGEIVNKFCEECSEDLPEKNFLFETGLYQFTCDESIIFRSFCNTKTAVTSMFNCIRMLCIRRV